MVVNTDGAPNPRAIGCSAGSVDWALRTAKGVTKLLSALPGSDREGADGASEPASITREGRYAFFTSKATNLAAGVNDDNAKTDIFRRDLASGATKLISADKDGKAANGDSDLPVANSGGGYVAFRSAANDLVSGIVSGASTVWLRSATTGYTQLISRRLNKFNEAANGENRPIAISTQGERVLFSSTGTDVVEGQDEASADRDADLFVFDTTTNKMTPVTVKAGSAIAAANGTTGDAAMSQDGRIVVFESTATDLVADFVDHNGDAPNLYKRDLTTSTTVLLDGAKGSATDGADAAGRLRDLSDDGQTVLFASAATDVVDGFADGNGTAADLYVRRGTTAGALVSGAGGSATQGANGAIDRRRPRRRPRSSSPAPRPTSTPPSRSRATRSGRARPTRRRPRHPRRRARPRRERAVERDRRLRRRRLRARHEHGDRPDRAARAPRARRTLYRVAIVELRGRAASRARRRHRRPHPDGRPRRDERRRQRRSPTRATPRTSSTASSTATAQTPRRLRVDGAQRRRSATRSPRRSRSRRPRRTRSTARTRPSWPTTTCDDEGPSGLASCEGTVPARPAARHLRHRLRSPSR